MRWSATGVLVSAGDLTLSAGDLTLSAGDLTLSAGDLTVSAGAVNVTGANPTLNLSNDLDPTIVFDRPAGTSYKMVNDSGVLKWFVGSPGGASATTEQMRLNNGVGLELSASNLTVTGATPTLNLSNDLGPTIVFDRPAGTSYKMVNDSGILKWLGGSPGGANATTEQMRLTNGAGLNILVGDLTLSAGELTVGNSSAILHLNSTAGDNTSRIYFNSLTSGDWGSIRADPAINTITFAPASGIGDARFGGLTLSPTTATFGGAFQSTDVVIEDGDLTVSSGTLSVFGGLSVFGNSIGVKGSSGLVFAQVLSDVQSSRFSFRDTAGLDQGTMSYSHTNKVLDFGVEQFSSALQLSKTEVIFPRLTHAGPGDKRAYITPSGELIAI